MSKFQCNLKGRTVVVTGASSGLGAEFGRALGKAGANVVLAARRKDRLKSLADEITAGGGKATAVEMDVTSEPSVISAFDAALSAFGSVDSVVANAGLSGVGRAVDMPIADFDQLMGVNLRGVFLAVREGARRMIAAGSAERKHGRVVIVSSITATRTLKAPFAYCASKAAVSRMGEALAREWIRQGINVNILAPGYAPSELDAGYYETPTGKRFIESFPKRRLMDPQELNPLLLYLVSDDAASVTGSSFAVDDGQTL